MDLLAYDPPSGYAELYKEQFASAAEAYFDDAVAKGRIDIEANAEFAAKIRKVQEAKESTSGKISIYTFLLVLIIVGLIVYAIILGCNIRPENKVFHWTVFTVTAVIGCGVIILKLYPALKALAAREKTLKDELDRLTSAARKQLAPLYDFFNWHTLTDLFSKVIPPVVFDEFLSTERLQDLKENFGFALEDEPDSTVTGAYSGTFYGYPFVFTEDITFAWGEKEWTGSLLITYRERVTNAEGKSEWVTKTQLLTASVTKPAPEFNYSRNFFFGHDAAPRLTFSRTPSSLSGGEGFWNNLNKKYQLRKLRKFEQNLTDESQYTMVANHDFEVLFRTEDRDNEVEFRLLYTPLAQQYMVKLLNDGESGYGDDFAYVKQGTITRIVSEHLNNTSLSEPPFHCGHFDLQEIRKTFLESSAEFFRSIYFSFAPLFLVPVYNEPRLNVPEEETPRTISASEIEGAASFFGAYFAPRESVTENIFNVSTLFYDDNVAHAVIESIGFEGIPRTDYVPCVGRDCNIHDVPVEWIEYIPVSRHTPIRIWRTEELPPEVEPLFCRRGFAFVAD